MICKTEGDTCITLYIVLNEQEMRMLEALKVGRVQRERKKKHILGVGKVFFFSSYFFSTPFHLSFKDDF